MFVRIGVVIGASLALASGGEAAAQTAPSASYHLASDQVSDRDVSADVSEDGSPGLAVAHVSSHTVSVSIHARAGAFDLRSDAGPTR